MTQHIPATDFDAARAEAFLDRVAGLVNDGAIATMISIGHRTGLFDTLAELPPATSAEIAEEAALAERYVREWLAVMVTGRIIDYDPARGTYRLPPEHAASLTRGGALGNMAVYAQHVALLGQVQDRLLACFETGAGTRYEDYPCFHHMMAEDSGQTVTAGLFDHILPLVPGLAARLEAGIDVLDAGCGQGSALIALAERYPRSRFTGYDLGEEAIVHAAEVARRAGLGNVRFETRDLSGYDERARFDLITSFDAVHDQKDPAGLIRGLHGALKARRHLPDAGHRRLGAAREQPRLPDGGVPLRDLLRALHAGVARPGRRRARHDVGMGDGRGDAARCGLCRGFPPRPAARSNERLVRGEALTPPP